jgi:hypothetical protein
MSQATDYLEAALLNHIFRGTTFTAPTTLYVALMTVDPTDSTGGTECSGTAYARVAVTCNTTNWSAPGAPGSITNSNAITWAVAGSSWGTINAVAFFDASSGGNMLMWLDISPGVAVASGQTASFAASALTVTAA